MAQTHNQRLASASSRHGGGMRRGKNSSCVGGEIMEVQGGGYIIRSTGKKDRHSKVYTANGPRDRRIRLSAHTAIQFYDVQDRLGYDRPSKAVDWLIMKAKAAIDELAQLPAWKPTITMATKDAQESITAMVETEVDDFEHEKQIGSQNIDNDCSSFLPPSLDSDAIADTIKSFFPIGGPAGTSSSVQFQSYPPDLLSRTTSHGQDLRLSLQSFKEPMLLHQQQEGYFASFDGDYGGHCGSGGGGFVFDTPSQGQLQLQQQQLLGDGQSQFFAERRPLQSSNTSSVRTWMDPEYDSSSGLNQQMLPSLHHQGFAFEGFPGFYVPRRIQGEEEHDGLTNKPSSASSDSRH